MKFGVTVNFSVLFLLFYCFNLNVAKNIESFVNAVEISNEITAPEAKQFTHFSVKHRRTERTRNDECKIDALKNLNLLDLIKTAQKNQDCLKVAAEVFQQKYAENYFVIKKHHNAYDDSYDYYDDYDYDDSSQVLVSDLQAATHMINHFGHLIHELAEKFNNDESLCEPSQKDEVINILKAIDAHCRESLVEFELNYDGCDDNNVFNQIRGPFERVEILKSNLYEMTEQTKDHQLQLNKIFPNVKQLYIDLNHYLNLSLNGCEFPKLEKLDIGRSLSNNYESNEPIFVDLLKRNPQIKRLTLDHPTFQSLRHVKKYSTQLQELDIIMKSQEKSKSGKTEENELIEFPTVKSLMLSIVDEKCRPPNGISFNETALQEISLGCDSGNQTDEYINFLLKYPKIKKLGAGNGLHDAQLLKLIEKFPQLSYAAFGFNNDVSVKNIIEFVKKSPSLNQLEFVLANNRDFDGFEKELKSELGADFNLKFEDMTPVAPPFSKMVLKNISIERKIPIDNNAACLCRNVVHSTFVMFMIAYVARFYFL